MNLFRYILCSVIITAAGLSTAVAQNPVPNAGFEAWTGLNLNGWYHNGFDPPLNAVTRSTDSFSGVYAAQGEVTDVFGNAYPPILSTGSATDPFFAVSENHISLSGQFKFEPQGGDMLLIEVVFLNLSQGGGGEGHIMISDFASTYNEFEIAIDYDDDNPPGWRATHGSITVTIQPPVGGTPSIGTWFLIDHFTFDNYPVNVEIVSDLSLPAVFEMQQNYPNPFNPSTSFVFSLPRTSDVRLVVYDLVGREVGRVFEGSLPAGTHTAQWTAKDVPSGTYFCRMEAGEFTTVRKLIVLK